MSQNKNTSTPRDAKRARFSGQKKKSGSASPLVLIAGLVAVLALIGGAAFTLGRSSGSEAQAQAAVNTSPQAAELSQAGAGSPDLSVQPATPGHALYPLVQADNGAVRLPLAAFDDNKAHFYTFLVEGRAVEFFVIKSSDGVVRAAFNACDVCFPAKKGYHQEGDEMVCNNCGRRFPSSQINVVSGGCNPSPLTRTVDGDTLVIQAGDLAAGLSYF